MTVYSDTAPMFQNNHTAQRNHTLQMNQNLRKRRILKQRARARRRRAMFRRCLLFALGIGCAGVIWAVSSHPSNSGSNTKQPVAYFDASGTRGQLQNMVQKDARVQQIIDQYDAYPEDLLVMLTRNEDMLDFVLGYPQNKGQVLSDTAGTLKDGEIPLFLQWDTRWGYGNYGDSILAICGCGPTTISMVIAGLTGDNTITPSVIAEFADQNGYYVPGAGSRWTLVTDACSRYGISATEMSLSEQAIFSELEQGHPIICCMRPGDFTTTGHFIVLTGIEDEKIKLNDCNSTQRSEMLWDYARLEYQIDNLWVCEME